MKRGGMLVKRKIDTKTIVLVMAYLLHKMGCRPIPRLKLVVATYLARKELEEKEMTNA
jgi:hypothetical protein